MAELPGGSTQLFVGLHLIHEVTSPQAFAALRDKGLSVLSRADRGHGGSHRAHHLPAVHLGSLAEEMLSTLERNC